MMFASACGNLIQIHPRNEPRRKLGIESTISRSCMVFKSMINIQSTSVPSSQGQPNQEKYKSERKSQNRSKTNSIEAKTIDVLKNAAVIFMNLFTFHCSQNVVEPTLKTIMDNGAASNELGKSNDKIEGETLKKLIHGDFRSKTLHSQHKVISN
ncbi:hypothetical protein ACTFIW_003321 [Dictyostelium discoideum]